MAVDGYVVVQNIRASSGYLPVKICLREVGDFTDRTNDPGEIHAALALALELQAREPSHQASLVVDKIRSKLQTDVATPPAVGIGGRPAGAGSVLAAGLLGVPVERGNPRMICPHCKIQGYVTTSEVKQKNGISGAKATGALLTGGMSVLATGLSRTNRVTQAHCTKNL